MLHFMVPAYRIRYWFSRDRVRFPPNHAFLSPNGRMAKMRRHLDHVRIYRSEAEFTFCSNGSRMGLGTHDRGFVVVIFRLKYSNGFV